MRGISFFVTLLFSMQAWSVDYQAIDDALQSKDGLTAEIHGSDPEHNLFVLVVRNKKDFFDFANLPLVGQNAAARDAITKLHRHDFVKIKGEFNEFIDSPQRHIKVDSIEVVKAFDPGYHGVPPYKHVVTLPADLLNKTEAILKVHGVLDDGQILMTEYKDTNVPVVVQDPKLVQDLYRGDKIKIKFQLMKSPKTPTHLMMATGKDAIQVLESIVKQDGKRIDTCGTLVLYVESPDIAFNVFALQQDIGDGYSWTYTLLHPTDKILFAQLRAKMQKQWDSQVATVVRGRNFFVNPRLQVCAKGKGNVVDPIQANPQIFIDKLDDLTLSVK